MLAVEIVARTESISDSAVPNPLAFSSSTPQHLHFCYHDTVMTVGCGLLAHHYYMIVIVYYLCGLL